MVRARRMGVAIILTMAAVLQPRFIASAATMPNANEIVVGSGGRPVILSRCRTGADYTDHHFNVTNLSKRTLLTFSVEVRYFDDTGFLIGNRKYDFQPTEAVRSGDATLVSTGRWFMGGILSEPENALSRITCRITSASFSGSKKWDSNQVWHESLIRPLRSDLESQKVIPEAPSAAPPPVVSAITVEKVGGAWLDVTSDGAFIHARVQLIASAPMTIRASDLQLAVKLESGVTMQLSGIDRQAPMADKPFATGATPSPQVKPQEDFGALGAITLQPKAPVLLIVTFAVPAAIASGNFDMQVVSIRK